MVVYIRINLFPETTQLEDPREEWRAIQEAMLREYLLTAQDVLEVSFFLSSSLCFHHVYNLSSGKDPRFSQLERSKSNVPINWTRIQHISGRIMFCLFFSPVRFFSLGCAARPRVSLEYLTSVLIANKKYFSEHKRRWCWLLY